MQDFLQDKKKRRSAIQIAATKKKAIDQANTTISA